jgi:hypothetical protein
MRTRISLMAVLLVAGIASQRATADPCGMVPPIYPGRDVPLTRVGLQQTYVFYKDGVETFVIRPGFMGKVNEFGMLIPFPTPPAIRKVPDHIFSHIAAAVDPPEVVVNLQLELLGGLNKNFDGKKGIAEYELAYRMPRDEVRVVRREAVGMGRDPVLRA